MFQLAGFKNGSGSCEAGKIDVRYYTLYKTVPYHPLYNIVIWPIFAHLYLHQTAPAYLWNEALILGASWAIITIVFDLFGWVLIKHPWRMTFHEMYVGYQPWITLIYISIFASPFIAALFF